MKIEVNGGYNAYSKKVSGDLAHAKASSTGGSKKSSGADVVEISRGNASTVGKEFTTLKSNLQRDINQQASAERLERIRSDIKGGTYHIPTEALIDSILGE